MKTVQNRAFLNNLRRRGVQPPAKKAAGWEIAVCQPLTSPIWSGPWVPHQKKMAPEAPNINVLASHFTYASPVLSKVKKVKIILFFCGDDKQHDKEEEWPFFLSFLRDTSRPSIFLLSISVLKKTWKNNLEVFDGGLRAEKRLLGGSKIAAGLDTPPPLPLGWGFGPP